MEIHKFFRTLQTLSIGGFLELAETLRPPETNVGIWQNPSQVTEGESMCTTKQRVGVITTVALFTAVVLLLAGWSSRASADEPIVGFWLATWTDATSGAVVNNVWDVWHSDRTETQNDTTNTIISNVCQGAWVPLGNRTYGLSHPGFNFLTSPPAPEDQEGNFDPSSSVLIFERITVDKSGNSFSGTGIVKNMAGFNPYDPTATVVSTQNIKITAKRVTVDVSQLPPG